MINVQQIGTSGGPVGLQPVLGNMITSPKNIAKQFLKDLKAQNKETAKNIKGYAKKSEAQKAQSQNGAQNTLDQGVGTANS